MCSCVELSVGSVSTPSCVSCLAVSRSPGRIFLHILELRYGYRSAQRAPRCCSLLCSRWWQDIYRLLLTSSFMTHSVLKAEPALSVNDAPNVKNAQVRAACSKTRGIQCVWELLDVLGKVWMNVWCCGLTRFLFFFKRARVLVCAPKGSWLLAQVM